MRNPTEIQPKRLERDARLWLREMGQELLRGREINLGELDLGAPDDRVEMGDLVDINRVWLREEPEDTAERQRVHFAADVLVRVNDVPQPDVASAEGSTTPAEDAENPDEVRLLLEFELDVIDARIAPDPQFDVLSYGPAGPEVSPDAEQRAPAKEPGFDENEIERLY